MITFTGWAAGALGGLEAGELGGWAAWASRQGVRPADAEKSDSFHHGPTQKKVTDSGGQESSAWLGSSGAAAIGRSQPIQRKVTRRAFPAQE